VVLREVMTFEYKIIPVQTEIVDYPHEINGFSDRRKAVSRKPKRDRRKKQKDRRSSVREGIIVNLSFKANRRRGTDRRRLQRARFPKP